MGRRVGEEGASAVQACSISPQRRRHAMRWSSCCPAAAVAQEVYVDMRQNVLLHVSVEEIGMRSTRWALLSAGYRQAPRDGGGVDLTYSQRCGACMQPAPAAGVGVGPTCGMTPIVAQPFLPARFNSLLWLAGLLWLCHPPTHLPSAPCLAGCPRTSRCAWWAWA